MSAVFTLHAGKAVVQVPAIEVPVNDLLDIGTEKSIESFKPFLVDLEKGFKMILHASVIIGNLRVPGTVNSGGSGHDFFPLRESDRRIFSWVEQSAKPSLMENVTKRSIRVRKKYVETECNSRERDNLLRHKLESVLSGWLSHKKTSYKYPSEILSSEKAAVSGRKKVPDILNLEDLPAEVQAGLK